MRRLIFLVPGMVVILAVVLLVIITQQRHEIRRSESIFAFATDRKQGAEEVVGVVRDTTIIAWIEGRNPQVSVDGKYVVASSEKAITSYNTITGKKALIDRTYDSFCPPQIASDDSLYVADPLLTLYRYPDSSKPQHIPNHLPHGPICPVGHLGKNVLVTVDMSKGSYLYRVSPDGAVHQIGAQPIWPKEDASNMLVATDHVVGDQPGIAFGILTKDSWTIRVVNPKTGVFVTPDMEALGLSLSGRGMATTVYVQDLWWGLDGHLYAIMGSWAQSPYDSKDTPIAIQSVWRLEDSRWVSADGHWVAAVRQLSPSVRLVVAPRAQLYKYPGEFSGPLFIDAGKTPLKLDDHVYSIAVPPADHVEPNAKLTGPPAKVPPEKKNGQWIGA